MKYYKFSKGYVMTDKTYPNYTEITEEEYLQAVPPIEAEATEADYIAALAELGVSE